MRVTKMDMIEWLQNKEKRKYFGIMHNLAGLYVVVTIFV